MQQTTMAFRGLKRVVMGTAVAVLASAALTAWAHPGARHGAGGAGPGAFLAASPERIDRTVDRLLDGVQASDAQRAQIKQIAQAAARDVRTQREAGRQLHVQARALFTAPTVDDAAVESLRQQMAQQHEAVSRRMSQALVEAAKVLTPEQRRTLSERWERRMSRHHGEGGRPARGNDRGALPSTVPMR